MAKDAEENKDGFIFYRSFYNAIHKIKNKETKSDIFEAVCELALNNNVIDLNEDIAQIILDLISPQIKANNKRYENGKKGGAKKGNQNAKKQPPVDFENNQKTTKKQPNVNVKEKEKEKDNDNVNDNENIEVFSPPEINVLEFYENNFGTLSSFISEQLTSLEKEHGNLKLKKAMEESILNNKKSLNYIEAILTSWKDKTWEEVLKEKEGYQNKKKKSKTIDWDNL